MMNPTDEYNRAQYIAELETDCAAYSKSMVEADRRANRAEREVEILRAQVAAQHDAMRTEWKDLLARAEKAEAHRDRLQSQLDGLVRAVEQVQLIAGRDARAEPVLMAHLVQIIGITRAALAAAKGE